MIKTQPVDNPTPGKLAETVRQSIEERAPRIQDYPKGARIATVKQMNELGYTIRKIAKALGMGKDTVKEYIDAEIDDKWVRYQDAVTKILTEKSDTLNYKVAEAINDKLQDSKELRLNDLTGLYRVLTDLRRGRTQSNNSTLIQTINVHPSLVKRETIVQGQEIKPDKPVPDQE